jgi:ubiquinone/menaquinone biosynthesis C-methylase UbiE
MKSDNQLFFQNDLIFDKTSKVLILDKTDGYTENFGKQWQDFNKVQIDSLNSFNISEQYLKELLFTEYEDLEGKTVLEVGCGAGRFTEHLVKKARICVSVDMSSAIFHNVSRNQENLILVKADFIKLKPKEKFDVVICRGVLQHTPNPLYSILKLHEFVSDEGLIYFDIYSSKLGKLHPKYFLWRPLIKTFWTYERFQIFLKENISKLLKIKRFLKSFFFNSDFISDSIIPVWDYKNKIELTDDQLEEWSVLDTLDGIYAKYDSPKSYRKVVKLLNENNIDLLQSDKGKNYFKTKKR